MLLPLTATALAGSVALYAIHPEVPMNRHKGLPLGTQPSLRTLTNAVGP